MTSHPRPSLFARLTTRQGAAVCAPVIAGIAALTSIGAYGGQAVWPGLPAAGAGPLVQQAQATGATSAEAFSQAQRQAIEKIVRDYLIQNPDVIMEVTRELEKRQQALQAAEHKRLIVEKKDEIFRASTDFALGNPQGDITVVEFFDYNCGWCKRAVDEITKLTKGDPKVRVVFKELPIFGENSALAAKAAMAALKQGKYWELHVALMKERQVTKDNLFKIAERVGLDVAKLKADMTDPKFEATLRETAQLAQSLGIEGTPGFIVDARVNVGFVPADGLNDMIAEIRKSGCQVC